MIILIDKLIILFLKTWYRKLEFCYYMVHFVKLLLLLSWWDMWTMVVLMFLLLFKVADRFAEGYNLVAHLEYLLLVTRHHPTKLLVSLPGLRLQQFVLQHFFEFLDEMLVFFHFFLVPFKFPDIVVFYLFLSVLECWFASD